MPRTLAGISLFTLLNVLPALAGWGGLAGELCKSDEYPKRDVPEGWEICESDHRTRLRCNKEGNEFRLREIMENKCTDKQLCWPPTRYQGPVEKGKTGCIAGTPPQGKSPWNCERPDPKAQYERACDPSGQWKWQCADSTTTGGFEWESLRTCKDCRKNETYPAEVVCDDTEAANWYPWLPVDNHEKVLHPTIHMNEEEKTACEVDSSKCPQYEDYTV